MFSRITKFIQCVCFAITFVQADSSTSSNSTSTNSGVSMAGMNMSASSTSVDNSPPYSITALPAVVSQSPCVFNCLIPIGLADPTGCDDVTENCACLSAPIEAAGFLTDCVATVCKSSTDAFASTATSLYESYCLSVYGSASISAAVAADSSSDAAAASSSIASLMTSNATTTAAGPTATGAAKTTSTVSGLASQTSAVTGDAWTWSPTLPMKAVVLGGLVFIVL